ncbi:hypothetical protein K1719_004673 [Acacia pycnantha]|nr:hypothetical protein K1719_004673 [Acacia pycnantha]
MSATSPSPPPSNPSRSQSGALTSMSSRRARMPQYIHECTINLLTGKTHQIRAQFAACKAPLVGDSMYMPAALAEMANPGVNPFGKHKKDLIGEGEKEMASLTWIEQHGRNQVLQLAFKPVKYRGMMVTTFTKLALLSGGVKMLKSICLMARSNGKFLFL